MIELNLPDMTCGHCASVVAKTISLVDPQAKARVDLVTKSVTIESGEERANFAVALTEAGYPPSA